jgi:ADP-ribosylglycohydrolase
MLGAIAGDIIGSVYEGYPIKTTDFPLFSRRSTFTDDTVLTVAVAHAILHDAAYGTAIKAFGRRYPHAGYGGSFYRWLQMEESRAYNSWGNGSAMRVSAVGFAFDRAEDVLREARRSAQVTHNHPEGIKGAQATALAIYLARTGRSRKEVRHEIEARFDYDLGRTLADIRPGYRFDVSCQGSVPESIVAFLESEGVEDAIRKAISLGGDSDTMGCIAGGIAEAYYGGVPPEWVAEVRSRLTEELWAVVEEFYRAFSSLRFSASGSTSG